MRASGGSTAQTLSLPPSFVTGAVGPVPKGAKVFVWELLLVFIGEHRDPA